MLPPELESNLPYHLMGPILKVVWKLSALYMHRPIEARLLSTPPLSGSTSIEDKELQFSSFANPKTLKVKLEPPKDRTNGERGWEGVQTFSSPIIWEKPLLLQRVSSPPSFFGQRLREPRNWAAAPPPCLRRHTTATNALPCSLLCLSLPQSNESFLGLGLSAGRENRQTSPLFRLIGPAQPCWATLHSTSRRSTPRRSLKHGSLLIGLR